MGKMNLPFNNKMNILNKPTSDLSSNGSASTVTASLQRMILRLKGKYLSDDGKSVDYQGLRNDDLFVEFESHVDQLYYVDLSELNQAQLKSFFISITVSIVIRLQDCFNKHYLFWFLLFSSSRCLQHTNNSWIVQM